MSAAAISFIANSIGRGVDLYLDRVWIDSFGGMVGDYFPSMERTWANLFLYSLGLTILAYFVRKAIVMAASWFEPSPAATEEITRAHHHVSQSTITNVLTNDEAQNESYYANERRDDNHFSRGYFRR